MKARIESRPNFKGVMIDLGDTLAYVDQDENRMYKEQLANVLADHGHKLKMEDIDSVLADLYLSSSRGELKTLQEFWGKVLDQFKIPRQQTLIDELERNRSDRIGKIWRLYDGAAEALVVLQGRYKLALVSNCPVGTDQAIDCLGLSAFFRCIILSFRIGARKPDKPMYREALRCLGLDASECIFVADEISDLEGAREVGLSTMLIRQGSDTLKEARSIDFQPDSQLDKISQITELL